MRHRYNQTKQHDPTMSLVAVAYLSLISTGLAVGLELEIVVYLINIFCLSSSCAIISLLVQMVTSTLTAAGHEPEEPLSWNYLALAYALAILVVVLTIPATHPYSSWDFLSYWAIETLQATNIHDMPDSITDGYEPAKQPPGYWGAKAAETKFASSLLPVPYLERSLAIMTIAVVYNIGRDLGLRRLENFLAICVLFVPLHENHLSNLGYAEVTLGLGVSLSGYYFLKSSSASSTPALFAGTVISFSLPIIKTSGTIFSALILLAFAGTYLKSLKISDRKIIMLSVLAVVSVWGLLLVLNGKSFGLLKTGTAFTLHSLDKLTDTLLTALVFNSSFSVACAVVICLITIVLKEDSPTGSSDDMLFLALFWIGLGTVAYAVLQTTYGMGHAEPGRDTSFSRLLTPSVGLMSVTVATLISRLRDPAP